MTIRTGIGGWVYEPWRDGVFYPKGLKQADELHYASRAVGAIEINATFYSRQKPESFACAEFTALMREAGVAIVYSEDEARAAIDEATVDFAYARLQGMRADCETGYPVEELDRLAGLCGKWEKECGEVSAFLINGAKERAPAAALGEMVER